MASKEKGLGGPAPGSVRSAEKALAAARRTSDAAAAAEPAEPVQARYGGGQAASIDRILQSGGLACSRAEVPHC